MSCPENQNACGREHLKYKNDSTQSIYRKIDSKIISHQVKRTPQSIKPPISFFIFCVGAWQEDTIIPICHPSPWTCQSEVPRIQQPFQSSTHRDKTTQEMRHVPHLGWCEHTTQPAPSKELLLRQTHKLTLITN